MPRFLRVVSVALAGGLLAGSGAFAAAPVSAAPVSAAPVVPSSCPQSIGFRVISGTPNQRPRTEARNSTLQRVEQTGAGTVCHYRGTLTIYLISPVPVEIPPLVIANQPWSKPLSQLG